MSCQLVIVWSKGGGLRANLNKTEQESFFEKNQDTKRFMSAKIDYMAKIRPILLYRPLVGWTALERRYNYGDAKENADRDALMVI